MLSIFKGTHRVKFCDTSVTYIIEPGRGEDRSTQHLGDDLECKLIFGMDMASRTGQGRKKELQPLKWRVPFDIFSSKIVIHFLKRIILFHRMKNNDKAKVILKNNTSKKTVCNFFSK